jgi:nucleotide-binding universal stress UspA family protein
VAQLGIEVVKVIASSSKPVKSSLDFLIEHPADLIVLAVHQYEGRMRWLEKRVGEPIARGAGEMTLFIPHGVQGFVSREDGVVSLRNILIPIARKPRSQPAVEAVVRIIRNLRLPPGTVTLLHVGSAGEAPSLRITDDAGWRWSSKTEEGQPAGVILRTANDENADLIVMTTEGPHGFLDALRGSTSERVLRKARCPVVSLPVDSLLN